MTMELLQSKLDNISVTWFDRSIRISDVNICSFFEPPQTPTYHRWNDGETLYCQDLAYDADRGIGMVARLSILYTE